MEFALPKLEPLVGISSPQSGATRWDLPLHKWSHVMGSGCSKLEPVWWDVTTSVSHTYCTQQSGSLFSGDGSVTLATFENKTAETMDTALSGIGGPKSFTADKTDFSVTYPIQGGLKIEEGKQAPLSLVIDTNRMLRLETSIRDDAKAAKDSWPKTRPYFFSTIFKDSSFVFTGQPGEIKGYRWGAYSCSPIKSPCKGTNDVFYIAGWLTSILNKDGSPLILNYMPDDDSTLTVIKGSNLIQKTDEKTGSVSSSADPEGYVKAADGSLKLKYNLGKGYDGSISLPSEPTAIDQSVEGTFAGYRESGGEFILTRKL